ncbi:MAG: hypothetical protein JNM82_12770 [Rhodocyclaceae bacterium]|nr:hypothetical protein [Rhodocyclaceae bacterium]
MDREAAAQALMLHYLDAIVDRRQHSRLLHLLEFGFPGIARMSTEQIVAECHRLGIAMGTDLEADSDADWTDGAADADDPFIPGGAGIRGSDPREFDS